MTYQEHIDTCKARAVANTIAAMDELVAVMKAGNNGTGHGIDLIRMYNCLDAASAYIEHATMATHSARMPQEVFENLNKN